jgi:hypothetical protein
MTWNLFRTGLPEVEIFDLELQSPSRIRRAATHGLGVLEYAYSTPAIDQAPVSEPQQKQATDRRRHYAN